MGRPYKVGYGKPPVETQFKPGQSGNSKGRAKGSKNIASMIQDALNEKVTINIKGRRTKISKLEAAFIQQSNKAAAGDAKAVKLMLDVLAGAELRDAARGDGEGPTPERQRADNIRILEALRGRLKGGDGDDV